MFLRYCLLDADEVAAAFALGVPVRTAVSRAVGCCPRCGSVEVRTYGVAGDGGILHRRVVVIDSPRHSACGCNVWPEDPLRAELINVGAMVHAGLRALAS